MSAYTVKKEKDALVVRIPINENPQPSESGKTLILATSHGNQPTSIEVNGEVVTFGFNAWIKNRAYKKGA